MKRYFRYGKRDTGFAQGWSSVALLAFVGLFVLALVTSGCGSNDKSSDTTRADRTTSTKTQDHQKSSEARTDAAQNKSAVSSDANVASVANALEANEKAQPKTQLTSTGQVATDIGPMQSEETASALAKDPVSFAEAEAFYTDGNYDSAVAAFTTYVGQNPDNAWGHYMLGLSCWKAGKLSDAETALRGALERDSDHYKSHLNLARVLRDGDRTDEALDEVTIAATLSPDDGTAHRVRGSILHDLGRIQDAVAAYKKALVLNDRDVWAMNNLGLVHLQEEQFEQALAPLARATLLRKGNAVFHNNLGTALGRTGHYTASADSYREALMCDSSHATATASLARVEVLREDPGYVAIDLGDVAAQLAGQIGGPPLSKVTE
ncbi:tetratricopeptide repeat protein [Candidatus Eisenbacteria bacterium]|uniref:Tetratricopeptide repeat protein n=1 Tax=Eiseniibacteriota bacterium TaxID=2212470 RepID=A0ABV6YLJ2_UNCEI